MLNPIPRFLLPHTALVRVPVDSELGGEHASEPAEVRFVRYRPAEEVAQTDYVLADGSKGLLIIDRVNSEGAFEVPADSLVEVCGEELYARKVTPFIECDGIVHHWEVELA